MLACNVSKHLKLISQCTSVDDLQLECKARDAEMQGGKEGGHGLLRQLAWLLSLVKTSMQLQLQRDFGGQRKKADFFNPS